MRAHMDTTLMRFRRCCRSLDACINTYLLNGPCCSHYEYMVPQGRPGTLESSHHIVPSTYPVAELESPKNFRDHEATAVEGDVFTIGDRVIWSAVSFSLGPTPVHTMDLIGALTASRGYP
jgi:hypothetical protein